MTNRDRLPLPHWVWMIVTVINLTLGLYLLGVMAEEVVNEGRTLFSWVAAFGSAVFLVSSRLVWDRRIED